MVYIGLYLIIIIIQLNLGKFDLTQNSVFDFLSKDDNIGEYGYCTEN
jgi:hypothetical protein